MASRNVLWTGHCEPEKALGFKKSWNYAAAIMKISRGKVRCCGFTLLELLLIIAIIAILSALLLPTSGGPRRAIRTLCLSNQHQIAIGFILYSDEHGGRFPMQTDGSCGDHVFPNVGKIQKYIGSQFFQIVVCPADHSKTIATNMEVFTDLNVSYFVNADSSRTNKPTMSVLMGDRNLTLTRHPVVPGTLAVTTNMDMNWSSDLHKRGGNVAFADGHLSWNKTNELNSLFARQPSTTNHIIVP